MISPKMQDAINDQINAEIYSSYLYMSMSSYFQSEDLPGFANWMRVQAQEEMTHALKFYDYVIAQGGRAILKAIGEPGYEWKGPLSVFEASYAHEQMITGRINNLATLAIEERDHATGIMLQWFVTEQIEEEANAVAIIKKLQRVGDTPAGLFMLDNELAARVFTPPATGAGAAN
jgi:ferritin